MMALSSMRCYAHRYGSKRFVCLRLQSCGVRFIGLFFFVIRYVLRADDSHVPSGGMELITVFNRARAFDEKVESLIVDSHEGANRIQDPHWCKGGSHEWGSLIPTICANVSLRQSKPVIPVRKLLSATTWL